MADVDVIVTNGHREEDDDIYGGITTRLENMICMRCGELLPLRILPCPKQDLFCESCMDWQLIDKKCSSCNSSFPIPLGGVSNMANDVTHDQIKDVLDSLCAVRATNCPLCALDENHAELASRVYKYCVKEGVFVCDKCSSHAHDLPTNITVSGETDRNHSVPDNMAATMEQYKPMDKIETFEEKVDPSMTNDHDTNGMTNGHVSDQDLTNGHDESSSEEDGVDVADSVAFTKPHSVSPSCSTDESFGDRHHTPPPAYDSHSQASPLPAKQPLEDTIDPPLMHHVWQHEGSPFTKANDVIFLPTDHSVIITDWYSGEVHKFSDGKHKASRLLKNSPWSFAKQRSQGPWSVAFCPTQNSLFVTEIGLPTLCRMTPDLKVDKKRIVLNGMKNPAGIAVLPNGQLILTEDLYRGPHRVAVYDPTTGMCVREWTCEDPQLVCVDCNGRIVVSNRGHNCVEVYDTTGRLMTAFKETDSDLVHPMGVATDKYCNIYVTHEEKDGYKLSMFSPDGRYIAALQHWDRTKMNLLDQEMWHMRSVDVDDNELVLLGRRTVQFYKLKGL